MLVMKFGGTSVGSAERMKDVLSIVEKAKSNHKGAAPLVVLSAMSGVTNSLIKAGERAVARDLKSALAEVQSIRKKHDEAIDQALSSDAAAAQKVKQSLDPHFEELEIILKGVSYLGELSKRSVDAISGMGELLSSKVLAAIAEHEGTASVWVDARDVMITDDTFGKATPLTDDIEKMAGEKIAKASKGGKVVITQGFIGRHGKGHNHDIGTRRVRLQCRYIWCGVESK